MRITNDMLNNRVTFNVQRALQRFFELQTQMSSGKRINQASDDPIGTQRVLTYRTELATNAQYQRNIDEGIGLMDTYDSILAELKDLVTNANSLAVEMANDTYDATARAGAASEVSASLDRVMQLANRTQQGKYIFSGYRIDTQSLNRHANGVTYGGDTGRVEFQIDTGARINVNLLGTETFLEPSGPIGADFDLNTGVVGTTPLALLHGGDGIDQTPGTFTITDRNLGLTSTIDVSGATTLANVITTINTQLAADGITNLTAAIGLENNNIRLIPVENGLITATTSVDVLNSGSGLGPLPRQVRVTDGGAIDVTIDLTAAGTVGDIITTFNAQLTTAGIANVSLALNGAGTALDITDSNGVPLGLRIEEAGTNGHTADSLGLLGAIDPVLNGEPLEPDVSFSVAETTGTTAADLGIRADIFGAYAGTDLNPSLDANTLLSQLNGGVGFTLGSITITHGDRVRNVDLADPALTTVQDVIDAINSTGLAITASINANGTGIQITNDDPNRSLLIEDDGLDRAAKQLGLFGSSDMMGSLIALVNALEGNDREGVGALLKNMDDAIQNLLNVRAAAGARAIRMESTDARLKDLDLGYTKSLSETEDADLAKLVTDLAAYESSYRASLNAAARIIQPSLLDFLR